MGFVNVARGLRAIGYTEPDPVPAGPVALVTHSGSVFSALLRARRGFGFTLAVSSGQELVTAPRPTTSRYALSLPRDRRARARAGGDQGRRRAARRARRRGPPSRHPGGAADRGHFRQRPGHGGRAFGRAGRCRRRLGGAGPGLRRAPGRRSGRILRHGRNVRHRPPGRARPRAGRRRSRGRRRPGALLRAGRPGSGAVSRRCTTPDWSGRTWSTSPSRSAFRSRSSSPATMRGLPGCSIRFGPGEPARRLGHRRGTRDLFGGCLQALADDPAVERWRWPSIWCTNWTATIPIRWRCWMSPSGPASPSRCSATSAASSIPSWPDSCAVRAYRCWKERAPACWPCGTCSITPALRRQRRRRRRDGVPARPQAAYRYRAPSSRHRAAHLGHGDRRGVAESARRLRHRRRPRPCLPPIWTVRSRPQADRLPGRAEDRRAGIAHKSDVGGVVPGVAATRRSCRRLPDLAGRLGGRALICQTVPAGTELALGLVQIPNSAR